MWRSWLGSPNLDAKDSLAASSLQVECLVEQSKEEENERSPECPGEGFYCDDLGTLSGIRIWLPYGRPGSGIIITASTLEGSKLEDHTGASTPKDSHNEGTECGHDDVGFGSANQVEEGTNAGEEKEANCVLVFLGWIVFIAVTIFVELVRDQAKFGDSCAKDEDKGDCVDYFARRTPEGDLDWRFFGRHGQK